jgi:uncharacterized membrane protein YjgN (DUF898 family)
VDALTSAPGEHARGIRFTGRWQDYLKIAVTNLLLTIVTLGIYRFWAKARVRRYLWSQTRIIDDELEWTGTGKEMFIGFLMVMFTLIIAYLAVVAATIALMSMVGKWTMIPVVIAAYVGIFWCIGFAQFRALRYRLSRTYWRGIRGGSDDNGVAYSNRALGRTLLAVITGGILFPAALTGNWNARWNAMSYGPHQFESWVETDGLQGRWMAVYGCFALVGLMALAFKSSFGEAGGAAAVGVIYLVALVAVLAFWALFFRKAAESFQLGQLTMAFPVSTGEWLRFYLKIAGLTVVTLGFGLLMWGYLRWKFVIDRLELFGEVDVSTLTQSTTTAPKDAEGFADAFDIGAF